MPIPKCQDKKKSHREPRDWSYWIQFGLIALVIVVIIVAVPFVIPKVAEGDKKGEFGDQYGVVNALFAGLAFAGLIITLKMQSDELRHQQKELKETQEIMKKQTESIAKQAFEGTFFSLLDLHHQIVNDIRYVSGGPAVSRKAIAAMGRRFGEILGIQAGMWASGSVGNLNDGSPLEQRKRLLTAAYGVFYEECGDQLGHYFRNLYHAVRFVDSSSIDDKEVYMKFLLAQLSESEMLMLFYNCCSEVGCEFMPLANQYELFRNLPQSQLFDSVDRGLTSSPMYMS